MFACWFRFYTWTKSPRVDSNKQLCRCSLSLNSSSALSDSPQASCYFRLRRQDLLHITQLLEVGVVSDDSFNSRRLCPGIKPEPTGEHEQLKSVVLQLTTHRPIRSVLKTRTSESCYNRVCSAAFNQNMFCLPRERLNAHLLWDMRRTDGNVMKWWTFIVHCSRKPRKGSVYLF